MFKTHITTVVNHFKGNITSWDVVNEAFEDNGTLRNTLWRQKLGPDYVARAFKYANEADPTCKLFYNDYGTEYSNAKLTAVVNMVNDFKRRGIPISGIGSQMHTNINHSNTQINSSLQQLASTGLLIHISELDIQTNTANLPSATYSATAEKALAEKYKYIAQAYGALPAAQQFGITMWNIGDADSWLTLWLNQKDWPCLFNDKYERKMAYNYFYAGVQ
jgi:endo-1,4-beta-xylanase